MRRIIGWGAGLVAALVLTGVVLGRRTAEPAPSAPRSVDDAASCSARSERSSRSSAQVRGGISASTCASRRGARAARTWRRSRSGSSGALGVGAGAPTGGILIVLDGEGGQARIEVSYSLEGAPARRVRVAARARPARAVRVAPRGGHGRDGRRALPARSPARRRRERRPRARERAARAPTTSTKLLAGHSGGAGAQVALPATALPHRVQAPRARRAARELRAVGGSARERGGTAARAARSRGRSHARAVHGGQPRDARALSGRAVRGAAARRRRSSAPRRSSCRCRATARSSARRVPRAASCRCCSCARAACGASTWSRRSRASSSTGRAPIGS